MSKKKGGLGKGLDILIRNKPSAKKSENNEIETQEETLVLDNGNNSNSESNNDIQNGINIEITTENNAQFEERSESQEEDIAESLNTEGGEELQSRPETFVDEKEKPDSDFPLEQTDSKPIKEISAPDKADEGEKVLIMKISAVEPNREQPRKNFREEGIEELASSIAQYGIIQPLLVQKRDDYYEIIAGERRWRAAMKAGLKEVPVIVKDYTNREAVEISLIENIQREDLNPIEEALAYERLITEFEMTQEEVAGRVSKSRSAVTNSLRLLRFEGDIRQMIIQGDISEGHARTLLSLPNEEMQKLLADRIIKDKLSVRDTEKLVKKLTSTKSKKTKEKDFQKEAILNNLSEQLKNVFGTKVSIIEKARSKGKIEIEYYSDDELNRIFEMLQSLR